MGFWDIFCPVFGAFLSTAIIMEIVHFGMGVWLNKKHQESYENQIKEMIAAGIDPSMIPEGFSGMGGMPAMFNQDPSTMGMNGTATASGEEDKGHGQYL